LLELVNATTGELMQVENEGDHRSAAKYKTFEEYLAQSPEELKDRFENLKAFLMALGDDVQLKQLKYYAASRRLENFSCVEVTRRLDKFSFF
jgi:hypothetical protein